MWANVDKIKHSLEEHQLVLIGELGYGGFSVVYRTHSKRYDQEFAVKVTPLCDDGKLDVAALEYEALRKMDHPNIIKIYEYFTDMSYNYLVMEYCEKGCLYNYVKKNRPLSRGVIDNFFKQIILAIMYCHSQGLAHNDIKPQNFLVDGYGRIKLGDFGCANFYQHGELSKVKAGSYMYMSPERILNKPHDPFLADSWAIGLTFYFIVTGEYAFSGRNKESVVQQIINGQLEFKYIKSDTHKTIIRGLTSYFPYNRKNASDVYADYLKQPNIVASTISHFPKLHPINRLRQVKASRSNYFNSLTFSHRL